jgi:hypothetical protein
VKGRRRPRAAKNRLAATLIVENDAGAATAALLEAAGLEFETMSAGEGMQGLLRRRPAVAIVDLDEASSRTTELLAEAAWHPKLSAMVVLGIGSRSSRPMVSELRRLICLVVDRGEVRRLRDLVLILQGA